MSLLPLADCARLLGIHPKTLRQWLQQDALPLFAHPRDARIKCLTAQQVEQLAVAHNRSLSPQLERQTRQGSRFGSDPPSQEMLTSPPNSQEETPLSQKLALLETRIAQLSEQVAHLTLALLQERERTVEKRLSDLETVVQELAGSPTLSQPPSTCLESQIWVEGVSAHVSTRPLIEAELRARSRMPALIEYSAQGTYVVVSSLDGELSLVPASREWFDWLATLSSFRFVGQCGRFTAYRETNHGKPTRGWIAHRSLHGRHHKHWLGVTDRLTIDRLEQMAAHLQSRLTML